MIWADVDGEKQVAQKGLTGVCPGCKESLIPRCGEINAHHWAHKGNDCDSWSEGETAWHIWWKNHFPVEWQEVSIGEHRADVQTPTTVVEFQHSTISTEEIRRREEYYGNMVWVVDASAFSKNWSKRHGQSPDWFGYKWKYMRKTWERAKCRVFMDFTYSRNMTDHMGYDVHPWGPDGRTLFFVKRLDTVRRYAWGAWVDFDVLMNSVTPKKYQSQLPEKPEIDLVRDFDLVPTGTGTANP